MVGWGRAAKSVRERLPEVFLLAQGAVAATIAWVIADRFAGHEDPFFAPIAAVTALSFGRGERGLSAVRMVGGVAIGIIAGELMLVWLGGGYMSLGLAAFIAAVTVHLLNGNRLMRTQAAASAILTVAVAAGEAGFDRLIDVLIGAAVALVFSQVLFSPEPVALVRRAEKLTLAGMARGLRSTAEVVEHDEDDVPRQVVEQLREVRDYLAELGRVRQAGARVARHSAIWWFRRPLAIRVTENTGQLDLLGASCLMLMRTAASVHRSERLLIAARMRELADVLDGLASDLGDRRVGQEAVNGAIAIGRHLILDGAPVGLAMAGAVVSARMVAYDIMLFAGVDRENALQAVKGRHQ
jgi:hypothetical protein